jgi:alpha-D-ribose 1-methylphosphonate 5-triphosphate diphosphatase PhnM
LDRALANIIGLGIAVDRAVSLVTSVPAAVLGLPDRGRLVPGARADIVALDPTSYAVRQTWVEGCLAA